MIETSASITNVAAGMAYVQNAVGSVARDSTNPHFKNRYASLENVIEAIRTHYLAAGLSVVQSPGPIVSGNLSLSTLIMHAKSGEWIKCSMQIPLGKVDPQGAGSAITYACRYSLMAIFNLPPVDDDGEAARVAAPPKSSQMDSGTAVATPFTLPTAISADMTLIAPSVPLDWGKMLSYLTDFAKESDWPSLKSLWRNNVPFFEALKAYSELDYERIHAAFQSKKGKTEVA